MPSKYDTNPLDPDFPEKARAAAAGQTESLPPTDPRTRPFASAPTEEQTRRFSTTYDPPLNGEFTAGYYPPLAYPAQDHSIHRKVEKIGIRENIGTAIPYFPWYFGMVAGILMLLFLPKSETKVRFHAAQGLAAHIGILIVTSLLGALGKITGVAEAGNVIFQLAATIMLFVFVFKAWKGRPIHIEAIDGLTNWLEEKLSPKTLG